MTDLELGKNIGLLIMCGGMYCLVAFFFWDMAGKASPRKRALASFFWPIVFAVHIYRFFKRSIWEIIHDKHYSEKNQK